MKIGSNLPTRGPRTHCIDLCGVEKIYPSEFEVGSRVYGRSPGEPNLVLSLSATMSALQQPLATYLRELHKPEMSPLIKQVDIISVASTALTGEEALTNSPSVSDSSYPDPSRLERQSTGKTQRVG